MDEEVRVRLESIEKRLDNLENKPALIPNESFKNKISSFFETDGEKIILTKIVGRDIAEKTKNIVLLTLLAYKQQFNKEKVFSAELREGVASNSIPLENFATFLKELIPQSIVRIGKIGSNKVQYKLTTFGEAKAKKLASEELEDAGSSK